MSSHFYEFPDFVDCIFYLHHVGVYLPLIFGIPGAASQILYFTPLSSVSFLFSVITWARRDQASPGPGCHGPLWLTGSNLYYSTTVSSASGEISALWALWGSSGGWVLSLVLDSVCRKWEKKELSE